MTFEIEDITKFILSEIENKKLKQKDIAKTYAIAIEYDNKIIQPVYWKKINEAIIKRWSRAGLKKVKEMAWKNIS